MSISLHRGDLSTEAFIEAAKAGDESIFERLRQSRRIKCRMRHLNTPIHISTGACKQGVEIALRFKHYSWLHKALHLCSCAATYVADSAVDLRDADLLHISWKHLSLAQQKLIFNHVCNVDNRRLVSHLCRIQSFNRNTLSGDSVLISGISNVIARPNVKLMKLIMKHVLHIDSAMLVLLARQCFLCNAWDSLLILRTKFPKVLNDITLIREAAELGLWEPLQRSLALAHRFQRAFNEAIVTSAAVGHVTLVKNLLLMEQYEGHWPLQAALASSAVSSAAHRECLRVLLLHPNCNQKRILLEALHRQNHNLLHEILEHVSPLDTIVSPDIATKMAMLGNTALVKQILSNMCLSKSAHLSLLRGAMLGRCVNIFRDLLRTDVDLSFDNYGLVKETLLIQKHFMENREYMAMEEIQKFLWCYVHQQIPPTIAQEIFNTTSYIYIIELMLTYPCDIDVSAQGNRALFLILARGGQPFSLYRSLFAHQRFVANKADHHREITQIPLAELILNFDFKEVQSKPLLVMFLRKQEHHPLDVDQWTNILQLATVSWHVELLYKLPPQSFNGKAWKQVLETRMLRMIQMFGSSEGLSAAGIKYWKNDPTLWLLNDPHISAHRVILDATILRRFLSIADALRGIEKFEVNDWGLDQLHVILLAPIVRFSLTLSPSTLPIEFRVPLQHSKQFRNEVVKEVLTLLQKLQDNPAYTGLPLYSSIRVIVLCLCREKYQALSLPSFEQSCAYLAGFRSSSSPTTRAPEHLWYL